MNTFGGEKLKVYIQNYKKAKNGIVRRKIELATYAENMYFILPKKF